MSASNIDRTNSANTGKGFEAELEVVFAELERKGIARIRKVDPPVRVVGGGFRKRVILLPNPFLDYAGVLEQFGHKGLAIFLEAKSTATHRLPLARDGGMTAAQCEAIAGWDRVGALAAVVWRWNGCTALFPARYVAAALAAGEKSLVFEGGLPAPLSPEGFLQVLRRAK